MTTDPQTAADAAERVQRWLDEWSFKVQSNLVATGCGRAEPDDCTELTAPDIDALLADRKRMAAELERRGQLLGIGIDHEQWDAIAETEGRRYEGEQTDDTIVGYLAYSRENARIARDAQRARAEGMAAELEQVRGERDASRDAAERANNLVMLLIFREGGSIQLSQADLVRASESLNFWINSWAVLAADLARLKASEGAETAATRPAGGLDGTGESQRTREVPRGAQQGAEGDGGGRD